MASEDTILAQRLECALCFELMREPKQLSCAHTFCEPCLSLLYNSQRKNDTLCCPACRQVTRLQNGDVSKLLTNFAIKAMVDDLHGARKICTVCDPEAKSIASVYCQMCSEYLCESCLEGHGKYRKTASHVVVSVEDIKKGKVKVKRFCRDHPQEEKLWVCTTCNSSICFRCRMLNHSDTTHHNIEDVTQFQKRMKERIESLTKKAEEKIHAFESHQKIVKGQDKDIDGRVLQIKEDINKVFEESMRHLEQRRNDLLRQTDDFANKLKTQLRNFSESNKSVMDSIKSSSDLVSNGMKTILEGESFALHTAFCVKLEDMLGKEGPNHTEPMDITRQTRDFEFTRYQGEGEQRIDIGCVKRRTEWELEKVNTYPLSSTNVYDMHHTPDGGMAVGYYGEGIGLYTVSGRQKMVRRDMEVDRLCALSDNSYVVRTYGNKIIVLTPDGTHSPLKFNINLSSSTAGLCTDKFDNIYMGDGSTKTINIFKREGGDPIRKLICKDFKPFYIRHMNHSNLLVVFDGRSTVRVIDEDGKVNHAVTKEDCMSIAVLQDDSIITGRRKDALFNIDLYTPQLKFVRTVLANFKYDFSSMFCLAEFQTGEIAFSDGKNLCIFRKL